MRIFISTKKNEKIMKTLSKSNGLKKLAQAPVSKNTFSYKVVSELLGVQTGKYPTYAVNGNKIRPVHTSGRGRFCSNLDYTQQVIQLLNSLGIEYTFTNDAPKGGLTGNLITITTKIK